MSCLSLIFQIVLMIFPKIQNIKNLWLNTSQSFDYCYSSLHGFYCFLLRIGSPGLDIVLHFEPDQYSVTSGTSYSFISRFFSFFSFFWLHWVFIATLGLSLVAGSWGYSSLQCTGFSLWWLLLWSAGSRVRRLQKLQLTGSVVMACESRVLA